MSDKEFSIVASAEAFETLSSKLYTNPIAAIVRELSSNAQDAHVVANQKKHFYLHVPTECEKYFMIRDYGNGMSEDFVMSVFTKYFASTKTNNNNQIGAFGLGSKTPYALVNEYHVTSYNGGKKTEYLMSKKTGIPVVEKISEENTNETGLEIRIDLENVSVYDVEEKFRNEAINFFSKSLFQPDWNIDLNDEEIERMAYSKRYFNKNSIIEDGDYESVRMLGFSRWEFALTVNVAGVVFNIPSSKFSVSNIEYNGINLGRYFSAMNIMADKNDVSVTPSREELHYDDKTILFLENKCKAILEEKVREMEEEVNQFESDEDSELEISDFVRFYNKFPSDSVIANKSQEILLKAFERRTFDFNSALRGGDLFSDVDSSKNKYYALLDACGCKTVQLKTINKALEETPYGKRVSSAFNDRARHFFKDLNSDKFNKSNGGVILIPNDSTLALKLLKNHKLKDIFNYMKCSLKAEEKTEHKKRGFITRNTYLFENGLADVKSCGMRSETDPYVRDNETPLVVNVSERNMFLNYAQLLSNVADMSSVGNILLRIAGENSDAKNIASAFQCELGIPWITNKIKENMDKITPLLKIRAADSFLRRNLISPTYLEEDVVNNLRKNINFTLSDRADDLLSIMETFRKDFTAYSSSLNNIWNSSLFDEELAKEKAAYEGRELDLNRYPMLSMSCNYSTEKELICMLEYISERDYLIEASAKCLQKTA